MSSPKVYNASTWSKRSTAAKMAVAVEDALPPVWVEYCNSWGFEPRYHEVKKKLEKEFPGIVVRVRKEAHETTGTFDVFVGNKRVHSKLNGDGWCDSVAKFQKIHTAIRNQTGDLEVARSVSIVSISEKGELDDDDEDEEGSNASIIVSLLTLMLSIPALIGAWCWPALVIGLVSGTVSSFARTLGHWLSLGITALMMIAVNWFMFRSLKTRFIPEEGGNGCCGRKCRLYGPCILTMVAAPLIMADLCRHVMGDLGWWPWCGDPAQQNGHFGRVNESWTDACFWSSTEYVCNIPCCVPGDNSVASTNDLSMNYLLITNDDGTNYQASFSENCGMSKDGVIGSITGAPYTNPNCTCGGGSCDPKKSPSDQVEFLTSDWNAELLAGLLKGDTQDSNYPQGFGPIKKDTKTDNAFLPPYWPAYPQLDNKTLALVKAQAIIGNVGVPPAEIPDCNCDNCVPPEQENIHHLSFIGVLFTIIFTYTGFVLLATGTLWNADIIHKLAEIKTKWKKLRAKQKKSDDKTRPLLSDNESKMAGDML